MTKKYTNFLAAIIGLFLCFSSLIAYADHAAGLIAGKWIPNGVVLGMAHDKANHALYIAGRFQGFGERTGGGAALDNAGTVLPQHAVFDGGVFDSVSDGNGGFYVGGGFANVDATGIAHVAHINSDGSVDQHFKPQIAAQVRHIAIVASRLYVATDRNVYEIDLLSGEVNPSFSLSADDTIYSMHATNYGVYVGGKFHHVNGLAISNFAKASRNTGVVDANYYRSDSIVKQIFSRSNDELFLVRYTADNRILKLHEVSGEVNTTFNMGRIRALPHTATVDGNWLYVSYDNTPYMRRYNIITGHRDIDFPIRVRLNHAPSTISFDSQYMYLTGAFTIVNGSAAVNRIARLNKATWQVDLHYHPVVFRRITTMKLDGSKAFMGGYFLSVGERGPKYLAKIDLTTGLPDFTFDHSINGFPNDIVLDSDRLFIGGKFTAIDNHPAHNLAMLEVANGNVRNLGSHANGTVYVVKKHRGYLYVGGNFSQIGAKYVRNVARFDLASLSQDTRFNFSQDGTVWDMAFAGKYIFVGGELTHHINKYSLDTGIKIGSFQPAVAGTVKQLLFDTDHLYVTGYFPQVVMRLNPRTGAERPKFKPAITGRGFSLAKYGNHVYVGTDKALERLNKITGEKDGDFYSHTDGIVYKLFVDDNTLYACGYFAHVFDQFMPYLSEVAV
ncbi:MAG: hypothetical protein P1U63_01090 [Coxiellaceae bacterium]|nr:hypothetical protein [Coxiellaceae bacterium]